jgi:nucleotide-binding universal stress UspA family protein
MNKHGEIMSKTIVVPVDGSKHSKKALEFACEYASKFDASLHLLHIAQPLHHDRTLVLGAAAVTIHASREELEKAGEQIIEAAKEVAVQLGCKNVKTEIEGGDPAEVIVETAKSEGADMIVIGSRGLSNISGLLMGSVSHKVNHLAPCTCVTVR